MSELDQPLYCLMLHPLGPHPIGVISWHDNRRYRLPGQRRQVRTKETMKTNYVLIDYENVQPDMAELLAPDHFKVIVFVGANQARVNFDLVNALQAKGAGSRYIKISGNGRNALDFHIAYYIGHLATTDPEAYFHVIAEDRGMDPLIEHLQTLGLQVKRSAAIEDIPIIKMDSERLATTSCRQLSRVSSPVGVSDPLR